MKKLLMALVTLLLVSNSVFAGNNAEATDDVKVFTSFIAESKPAMPPEGTIIGNKIEELTGVRVEMEYLVGSLETKAGVMLASGDMPDFINARNEHYRFRSDGYLAPLEDLIEEHAPNIKKYLAPEWDTYFQEGPDGTKHIYSIPDLISYGELKPLTPENAWYIQSAVLEEFGWPKIETVAEYFDIIEQYKEKYPTINGEETIGFEILTYDWYKWYAYEGPATACAGAISSDYHPEKIDGKWVLKDFFDMPEYKKLQKEYNSAYRRGLINPEGFVNTLDQYRSSLSTGRVLGTYNPEWVIAEPINFIGTNMPERRLVGLSLKLDKNGTMPSYNDVPATTKGMGTSISVNCEDKVGAIKYLNAVMSEEIMMLGYWGREGEDYYRDENGRVNRTPEQIELFSDTSNDFYFPVWGGEYYIEFWPSINGTFDDGTCTRWGQQPEIFQKGLDAREKEILDNMGWSTFSDDFMSKSAPGMLERGKFFPLYDITAQTGSIEQQYETTLSQNGVKDGAIARLIMAQTDDEFEAIYEQFVNDVKELPGYKEHKAFKQAGIDAKLGQ